jgi:hypothetical protein
MKFFGIILRLFPGNAFFLPLVPDVVAVAAVVVVVVALFHPNSFLLPLSLSLSLSFSLV